MPTSDKSPNGFWVSMPKGDCVFNGTVGMDIIKIGSTSVLPVADKDTKISAVQALNLESRDKVGESFSTSWVAMYIGFGFRSAVVPDQGEIPELRASKPSTSCGIFHIDIGIESQNAMAEMERYDAYLRDVIKRARREHSNFESEILLQLTDKA